ncbi:MAG: 1,4-alpha-glucan branching protein domain-containing protein [Actinomycetota bacterium]
MGIFALVLHTHLPYVRHNGVWPCGEDFFHQAAVESYLPLLGVLEDLGAHGMTGLMSLGLSPMVAHQMEDPHMLRELGLYLGRFEARAWQQVANYEGVFTPEFKDLAAHFAIHARAQSDRLDACGGIARSFGAIADAGVVELLGGPVTHPFLPRVRAPELIDAQVRLGAEEHKRILGRRPRGMWLPECAYQPGAGIEETFARAGVGHVVVDGPTMLKSAGPGSTFAPRRIGTSDVVAFARDLDVSYRVWSPTGGYPSGKWYRDFYHYDLEAGFKNWRVTSIHKSIGEKRPYEPKRAAAAARQDAENFAALIAETLSAAERRTGREGVVVAAYDTELFGHWWFEGPEFLRHLFTVLDSIPGVRACSLERARELLDEPEPVDLIEGSWGFRKDDRSWVSDGTQDMWWFLGEIERETPRLLQEFAGATGARREALSQLVRETMLLESSDWPFMVIRGRAPEYAYERFATHQSRWHRLADLIRSDASEDVIAAATAEIGEIDNILPGLRCEDVLPA